MCNAINSLLCLVFGKILFLGCFPLWCWRLQRIIKSCSQRSRSSSFPRERNYLWSKFWYWWKGRDGKWLSSFFSGWLKSQSEMKSLDNFLWQNWKQGVFTYGNSLLCIPPYYTALCLWVRFWRKLKIQNIFPLVISVYRCWTQALFFQSARPRSWKLDQTSPSLVTASVLGLPWMPLWSLRNKARAQTKFIFNSRNWGP